MRLVLARTLFLVYSIVTFAVSKPVPGTSPQSTSNQSLSEPSLDRVVKIFIVAPAKSINIEALKTAPAFPFADPVKYTFALLNNGQSADQSSVDMTDFIVAAMASISSKPHANIEVNIVDTRVNADLRINTNSCFRALEVVNGHCLEEQSCILAIPFVFAQQSPLEELKKLEKRIPTLPAPVKKLLNKNQSDALYVAPISKGKHEDWKKSSLTYAPNIDLFVHTSTSVAAVILATWALAISSAENPQKTPAELKRIMLAAAYIVPRKGTPSLYSKVLLAHGDEIGAARALQAMSDPQQPVPASRPDSIQSTDRLVALLPHLYPTDQ